MPQPFIQAFSRTKTSKAVEEDARDGRDDRDGKSMDQLRAGMEDGDVTLDQRLGDMGLDPNEYKRYTCHQSQRVETMLTAMTVYGEANRPRTQERKSGSPRLARKRSSGGRTCRTRQIISHCCTCTRERVWSRSKSQSLSPRICLLQPI